MWNKIKAAVFAVVSEVVEFAMYVALMVISQKE